MDIVQGFTNNLIIIYMNLVTGKDFDLLKHRAVNVYGARDLSYSNRKNKKYMVTLKNGNKIIYRIKIGKDAYNTEKEHPR